MLDEEGGKGNEWEERHCLRGLGREGTAFNNSVHIELTICSLHAVTHSQKVLAVP